MTSYFLVNLKWKWKLQIQPKESIAKETEKSQHKSVRFLISWTREPGDCVARTERARQAIWTRVSIETCKQVGDE